MNSRAFDDKIEKTHLVILSILIFSIKTELMPNRIKKIIEESEWMTVIVAICAIFAFVISSLNGIYTIVQYLEKSGEEYKIVLLTDMLTEAYTDRKRNQKVLIGDQYNYEFSSNLEKSIQLEIELSNQTNRTQTFKNLEFIAFSDNGNKSDSLVYHIFDKDYNKCGKENAELNIPAYTTKKFEITFIQDLASIRKLGGEIFYGISWQNGNNDLIISNAFKYNYASSFSK